MAEKLEGYQPPPPDLIKKINDPKFNPGEIRGMAGNIEIPPDRRFFILENRSDAPDRVWQAEGYCVRDGTNGRENWKIHMICPRCDRGLTLDSMKKEVSITAKGIESEAFRCAWHGDFGSLLCTFMVGIRLPKNENEALVRCDEDPEHPRRIDGVFVDAR